MQPTYFGHISLYRFSAQVAEWFIIHYKGELHINVKRENPFLHYVVYLTADVTGSGNSCLKSADDLHPLKRQGIEEKKNIPTLKVIERNKSYSE